MREALFVVTTMLLVAGSTSAQEIHRDCPEDIETDEQAQAEAGKWFAKGERLAEKGEHGESVEAFLCSYALAPHPASVFNAAQAARMGGDASTAKRYLQQYLGMAPNGPHADQAREQLSELGGAEPEEEPAPPAATDAEETGPPSPSPEDFEAPWAAAEPDAAEEEAGASGVTIGGWVLVGVGAAGIVTGAVLQGLAGKAVTDGEAMNRYEGFEEQQEKVDGLQTGALVGFIAGGVLVGGGIVMLVIAADDDEGAVEVAVTPTPGGVTLGGTF